jgi:hypothetical protein
MTLAFRYLEKGETDQARKLVQVADRLQDRLDAVQRDRLQALKTKLAEAAGPEDASSGRTRD